MKLCAGFAVDKKAERVVALDLREVSTFTDYFLVCSGTSEPQIRAIASEIEARMKEDHDRAPFSKDGYPVSKWVILDYSDVLVHVFLEETRDFYGLEDLWSDCPRLEFSAE